MKKFAKLMLGYAVIALFTQTTSFADDRDHRFNHGAEHRGWHGDIRHFHDYDIARWRGGHWYNGWHNGRRGSWWIVNGVWYLYPRAIYPYPDPYQPPTVMIEESPTPPDQTPPPVSQAQFWYYCSNPQGYYPYVPQCSVDWQKVPSSPPPDMQPH